jgi:hypothetical protein
MKVYVYPLQHYYPTRREEGLKGDRLRCSIGASVDIGLIPTISGEWLERREGRRLAI